MAIYQYSFTSAQALAPAVVGLFVVSSSLPWLVVAACAVAAADVIAVLGRRVPDAIDRREPAEQPMAALDG